MRRLAALTALCAIGMAGTASAGPHIGMKLACKRYGDAWNSGSRYAVMGACTGDFAHVWSRMPSEAFAALPRGGSGSVMYSSKGRGSGTVTVSTPHGVMTFVVVGKGFRWTVADIYRAGDDGRTVSVKSYVDCSVTANEFMKDLKYAGGTSFHDSITPGFASDFRKLSRSELDRIREFLPDVRYRHKPTVIMNGSRATIRVRTPDGGPQDFVTFQMVRHGSWKVDDYAIDCSDTQIASFRRALPVLAGVTGFNSFVKSPAKLDPKTFTAPGELRDELAHIHADGEFPIENDAKFTKFEVADDLSCATITYPQRTVCMHFGDHDGRCRLCSVEAETAGISSNVANLLAVRRRVSSLSFASAITNVFSGADNTSSEPVVVANAAHTETVIDDPASQPSVAVAISAEELAEADAPKKLPTREKPAATKVDPEVVVASAPATVVTSQPVQRMVYYSSQPTYYSSHRSYKQRRGLFGKIFGRKRR